MMSAYGVPVLYVVCGLVLLIFAADWLVRGSVALARRLGISELIIGLTIVALGTSAPELFTGIRAAVSGNAGIALGNAVGSNITNLGLVLGLCAMVGRIPVGWHIAWQDGPLMLLITGTVYLMLLDGVLGQFDGLLLLLLLIPLGLLYWRRAKAEPESVDATEALPREKPLPLWQTGLLITIGLAGLAWGADMLVHGASTLARAFGVSDLLIGATVVALGTSAPELASSLMAIRRKAFDLVLGNLVGSCKLNILAILGLPALIYPLRAEDSMLQFHLPALALISIVAWLSMISRRRTVIRREGALLVGLYVSYLLLTLLIQ